MTDFSPTYCPQCGKATFARKHGTCYVCQSCQFEYYHNTAAAVAGLIEWQGKILLTRRAKEPFAGRLDLPGGFIDPAESLEQGLSREIFEELGIHINDWRYVASGANQYVYKNVRYNTLNSLFVAKLNDQPQLTLQTSEIIETVWADKSHFDPNELAFASLQRLVQAYLQE
ncbi:NUDIX domain-containing protein [Neiella sp. HB171785]|uniref:NUDIX domain-containing protein n=1 Tax=Neiella litorisoli TaxID=2771431 RepID=A0A8J6UIU8_9GAMM|nr:NUDIX domain-containing protein [Neiella litorisoli]MBD1389148.1 NUDIX domain-containing protein [Neiella litorisoli]